jgi:hypothetical protein
MTVLFVFGDMLEEGVSLAERPAVLEDFAEDDVSVDEETEVTVLPETVATTVTRLTLGAVLVNGVVIDGVGVAASELVVNLSVVLDELLVVRIDEDEDVGEVVGVAAGVLLADVLFIVAEVDEDDESEVVSAPPAGLVAAGLIAESTSFFSTSRSRMFESSQFA